MSSNVGHTIKKKKKSQKSRQEINFYDFAKSNKINFELSYEGSSEDNDYNKNQKNLDKNEFKEISYNKKYSDEDLKFQKINSNYNHCTNKRNCNENLFKTVSNSTNNSSDKESKSKCEIDNEGLGHKKITSEKEFDSNEEEEVIKTENTKVNNNINNTIGIQQNLKPCFIRVPVIISNMNTINNMNIIKNVNYINMYNNTTNSSNNTNSNNNIYSEEMNKLKQIKVNDNINNNNLINFLKNMMYSNFCNFTKNKNFAQNVLSMIILRIKYLESQKCILPQIFFFNQQKFLINFIKNKNPDSEGLKSGGEGDHTSPQKLEKEEEGSQPDRPYFYHSHKEEVQTKNVLFLIEGLFSEENIEQDFYLLNILNRDGYASLKELPNHPQLKNYKIKNEHLITVFSEHRDNEITETVETFNDIIIRNKKWIQLKKKIPHINQVMNDSLGKIKNNIDIQIKQLMFFRDNFVNKMTCLCSQYQINQINIQQKINGLNEENIKNFYRLYLANLEKNNIVFAQKQIKLKKNIK